MANSSVLLLILTATTWYISALGYVLRFAVQSFIFSHYGLSVSRFPSYAPRSCIKDGRVGGMVVTCGRAASRSVVSESTVLVHFFSNV